VGGAIAKSSGAFFFIWTLLALGVTALFSVILSGADCGSICDVKPPRRTNKVRVNEGPLDELRLPRFVLRLGRPRLFSEIGMGPQQIITPIKDQGSQQAQ
jgi:hypothetical protein